MPYYSKNLRVNETIISVIKKYFLTYFGAFFLGLLFIILSFFLLYLLFQWGSWGVVIFVSLLVIGLILFLRAIVLYYYNNLIITNQRLIYYKQQGFFHRWVYEVFLDKIQDLSYEISGVWQMVFKYGNLNIQVINSNTIIKVKKIKSPEKIQTLINQIKANVK